MNAETTAIFTVQPTKPDEVDDDMLWSDHESEPGSPRRGANDAEDDDDDDWHAIG